MTDQELLEWAEIHQGFFLNDVGHAILALHARAEAAEKDRDEWKDRWERIDAHRSALIERLTTERDELSAALQSQSTKLDNAIYDAAEVKRG